MLINLSCNLLRSSEGASKITLYGSLLFKLASEHKYAEHEENKRHGIEAAEGYAAIDVKCEKKGQKRMVYRRSKDYTTKAGFAILFCDLTYKVGTLEESVVLRGAADHLTLDLNAVTLFLYVDERLALIFIKFHPIIDELGVLYDVEEFITRDGALKLNDLHNYLPRQE